MTDMPETAIETEVAVDAWRAQFAAFSRSSFMQSLILGLFSLGAALLLVAAENVTRDAIEQRVIEDLHESLSQVIPLDLFDNDPTSSLRSIPDASGTPIAVHVAASKGEVTAVAFELTGYGYSGAIRVLMGMAPDGSLLGVRVLSHTETPGLGDKIEAVKSDWVMAFNGRSLVNPEPKRWRIKKDGGVFDQFSGASITPRAVVATVKRGLTLFNTHKVDLLAPFSGSIEKRA